MEIAKEASYLIFRGFIDCISGIYELINYLSPPNNELTRENVERISARDSHSQGNVRLKARSKLFECFAFGLYFVVSYLIFNHFLLQFSCIQLVEWTGEDVNSYFVTIHQKILTFMFTILWIVPLLCLSKFLYFSWYQDISNSVLLKSGQKKYEDIKISDFYADQIKSLVLQMIFYVQGLGIYGIKYLPCVFRYPPWYYPLYYYVECAWYFFHCALLFSLYAFEYKWVYTGWSLHRRIMDISIKWPYYFGFGIPLALINMFFSSFILSLIVFSTLFPVYVISSSVTHDHLCPAFRYPIFPFKLADYLTDFIIKRTIKYLYSTLGSS